ncbi:MAG: hypothetical protein ACKODX_18310 [Gemmata sp.]
MSAAKPKPDLSLREVIAILFRDRAVRAYTFAVLGALAVIFAMLAAAGSDVGGVVVVLFGAAALVLRWTAMPPLLVFGVAYFQLFPFGVPYSGSENPFQVRETYFQGSDMVLVLAVLVYLRAQYRAFGFVHQIMPGESVFRRKGEAPTRRPPGHVRPDEIAWLVGVAAAVVVVGQGLWWLANEVEVTPLAEFPLRLADEQSLARFRRNLEPGEFRPGQHRFFVLIGGLFFGTLIVRLAFGYWQWRVMGAAEGALVLADTSWAESHRERARVEKWRIWGRRRAERREKEAERARRAAERAREEREAQERARQKRNDSRRRRSGPRRD